MHGPSAPSELVIIGSGADPRLQALSEELGSPLISEFQTTTGFYLQYRNDCLCLGDARQSREKPVSVDFAALARKRRGGELLVRAIGRGGELPLVLDATAGLGRDAFVVAANGYRVILLERDPVVAALLADGLRRGLEGDVADICQRMRLLSGDAREALSQSKLPDPGVVYLDPMFGDSGKTALAKKEMRLFQALLGHGEDDPALLEQAIAVAYHRVVVKRALKAPPLGGREPSFSLRGKAVRFDVYGKRKF